MPLGNVNIVDTPQRKSQRHWLYASVIAWGMSFIIMAVFGVYVIIRGQQVNTELCRVSDDNRTILINILNVAKRQSLEEATGVLERNLIRQRYNTLRALIPPLKCSTQGGPKELEP